MPLALLALAIGTFGLGTTEFVPMGLLPQVAADFHVTIPTAGLLVTGYALGVAFGAPLMTALGTKLPRKRMLMLMMGLFILGNLLSALAPSFGLMMVGRIVTSLAPGAFFGIGAVLAAELVAPEKKASAIAIFFTGLTVANVVGVPLGTYIGQAAGWRTTFVLVAGLGVIGLLSIAKLVPELPRPEGVHLRHELAAVRKPQVLLALAMTVLGFGGVFAAITYIAPMMTHVAGFSDSAVTWLLVLFGIGMVIGNLLGGRFADRALMPMLYTTLGGLAVVLGVFTLTAHSEVLAAITVLLVGAFGFATVPPLNVRVINKAHGAPTLAAAVNAGAFNLGNALAAWLGGLVIAAGFGYTSPNWVGALMTASALGLALWSAALERREKRTAVNANPGPVHSELTSC
ncbi:MFS transporter [Streptomyces sp. NPDC047009]|uniref:MFS transporter n=1 Tax=Streptomyces sp. NPDC047009 TaxID=3154496 RepID=UPI00340AD4E2